MAVPVEGPLCQRPQDIFHVLQADCLDELPIDGMFRGLQKPHLCDVEGPRVHLPFTDQAQEFGDAAPKVSPLFRKNPTLLSLAVNILQSSLVLLEQKLIGLKMPQELLNRFRAVQSLRQFWRHHILLRKPQQLHPLWKDNEVSQVVCHQHLPEELDCGVHNPRLSQGVLQKTDRPSAFQHLALTGRQRHTRKVYCSQRELRKLG
mmetsp:Transcript_2492/g.5943  ORF Transcript_2492/g.5943 Transcript_2492/m.5943 type:complete len:204 (-) Transcript_2492:20-631(-)